MYFKICILTFVQIKHDIYKEIKNIYSKLNRLVIR